MEIIKLTEEQYYYLKPVYNLMTSNLRHQLYRLNDNYYFRGDGYQIENMYQRLEGLSW